MGSGKEQDKTNTQQILVVLTTIIVEQSIIKSQPKLFESFVETLCDTISKINSGPDRVIRSIVSLDTVRKLVYVYRRALVCKS